MQQVVGQKAHSEVKSLPRLCFSQVLAHWGSSDPFGTTWLLEILRPTIDIISNSSSKAEPGYPHLMQQAGRARLWGAFMSYCGEVKDGRCLGCMKDKSNLAKGE